jgi:hypothetical protein
VSVGRVQAVASVVVGSVVSSCVPDNFLSEVWLLFIALHQCIREALVSLTFYTDQRRFGVSLIEGS